MLSFLGHSSPMNNTFLFRGLDCRVLAVCVRPPTTHSSQTVDVSVFAPLNSAYAEMLKRRYLDGELAVWKGNAYNLIDQPQKEAFTSEYRRG